MHANVVLQISQELERISKSRACFFMSCKAPTTIFTEKYKHSIRFFNLKLVKNVSNVLDKLDELKQLDEQKSAEPRFYWVFKSRTFD